MIPNMDAHATDTPTSNATPPPLPQQAHFPTIENRHSKEKPVMLLALALLLVAILDSSGHLLHCLVTRASPDYNLVLFRLIQPFIFWAFYSAFILWFTSIYVVKDYRILGDRFIQTFPLSWKEFSLTQLERVVLYEDERKTPMLVHLKFRGYRRVLVDDLINMPQFITSLRASIPADLAVEIKPHLGIRYRYKILLPIVSIFLFWLFTKDVLPMPVNTVLVLSFSLLIVSFIAIFSKNPSLGRGPLLRA